MRNGKLAVAILALLLMPIAALPLSFACNLSLAQDHGDITQYDWPDFGCSEGAR